MGWFMSYDYLFLHVFPIFYWAAFLSFFLTLTIHGGMKNLSSHWWKDMVDRKSGVFTVLSFQAVSYGARLSARHTEFSFVYQNHVCTFIIKCIKCHVYHIYIYPIALYTLSHTKCA